MGVGGGRLFEAGRLLTFPTCRVGAYLRWALIPGWALNQINTVCSWFQFGLSSFQLSIPCVPTGLLFFCIVKSVLLIINKIIAKSEKLA